jgi:hypothetical protein
VQWLSDADQKALDAELGETAIPSRQIRGWFFKEEVQKLLRPRLSDLVFNHPTFSKYGWKERTGDNPQGMSGCPWHGGKSGTSFQYSKTTGCWDCKACGVGGDVLDFVHKTTVGDLYAERPQGPDVGRRDPRRLEEDGKREEVDHVARDLPEHSLGRHREKDGRIPPEWIYPQPAPETVGLRLAPDAVATVAGAVCGGVVLRWCGGDSRAYAAVFIGSSVLRLAALPLLLRLRRKPG